MSTHRSVGLTAFMAFAARGAGRPMTFAQPRPEGGLVWLHISEKDKYLAAQQLSQRLLSQREGVTVLMTGPAAFGLGLNPIPDDRVQNCTEFLDHWRPDLCLWVGGDLRPCLLTLTHQREIPMVLIDPKSPTMSVTSRFWTRSLFPAVLPKFTAILVDTDRTVQNLQRRGAMRDAVSKSGAFEDGSRLLPFDADTRAEWSTQLRNRPVWLAKGVRHAELATVLAAHRRVLQFSLRSILVLSPDEADGLQDPVSEFSDVISASDLRMIRTSTGQTLEEITQIVLVDDSDDLGVWYRIAPVCFLGSSLKKDMRGQDPNEPAAHGSAILSGPYTEHYTASFDRFLAAGAARLVQNETELANAIKDLSPPDKSAIMAQAAWDVASRGAQVMDQIVDLSQDLLDVAGAF